MIVSHKHKIIFVKTRKTAGTSIEVFLSGVCGEDDIVTPITPEEEGHRPRNHEGFFNHMSGQQIRSRIGNDIWDSYFKFCVERNPWDKAVSAFFWSGKHADMHSLFGSRDLPLDHGLYLDENGEIMVDKIIFYEDLARGLSEVFSNTTVEFKELTPRAKGKSRKAAGYREMYDEKSKAIIADLFRREIELFGFEF